MIQTLLLLLLHDIEKKASSVTHIKTDVNTRDIRNKKKMKTSEFANIAFKLMTDCFFKIFFNVDN